MSIIKKIKIYESIKHILYFTTHKKNIIKTIKTIKTNEANKNKYDQELNKRIKWETFDNGKRFDAIMCFI